MWKALQLKPTDNELSEVNLLGTEPFGRNCTSLMNMQKEEPIT